MKKYIVLATLSKGGLVLLGSDLITDMGLIKGNAVTLMLNCKSKHELKALYDKLSEGRSIRDPLQQNYWGVWSVNVLDKFGHHWLLHCE